MIYSIKISFMKQQCVITHTICQTEIIITRQCGFKGTFYQNFMSTKKWPVLIFS